MIIVQYNYNFLIFRKLVALNGKKFIGEITAQDPKRQENLQFIAGYTLLNDCRYEKIFVLTGEGSNGKTIFTKVLEQVYGTEKCYTHRPTRHYRKL